MVVHNLEFRSVVIRIAPVLLAAVALAGCSSQDSSEAREERASRAVAECRGHGGVAAFDDDAVICADQSSQEERGSGAIDACRDHGGVAAFDDDIVICRDETFHEVPEG
jgi:hypothetical protein